MVLVDTNVFLHAVNRDSPDHGVAYGILQGLANRSEPWALTWGIFYEYLRVATHAKVFPHPLTLDQACRFMVELLDTGDGTVLVETELHAQVMQTCMGNVHRLSGNLVHDFHTAVLMREHGVKEILTFDTDFRVFPWLTIRALR